MIVVTAGHVDHGKTTLIRALTGKDTDSLTEEKTRGMSINLGFAYHHFFSTSASGDTQRHTISFVDVPGHTDFTGNMLAGAWSADVAMIVVAAEDGIMPQTREHVLMLQLLGIKRAIIVVSAADRATTSRIDEVASLTTDLLAATAMHDAPTFAVSATKGDGIASLLQHLESIAQATFRTDEDTSGYLRFAVDRSFVLRGIGTVVTGTVRSGSIRKDDKLLHSSSGELLRVRSLYLDDHPVESAASGQRVALGVTLHHDALRRGDWLMTPALRHPVHRFDARIEFALAQGSGGTPSVPKVNTPLHLHLGAAHHIVTLRALGPRGDGELPQWGQIRCREPMTAHWGDTFILRDATAQATIAGGIVLDIFAPRRKPDSRTRLATLNALRQQHGDALCELLEFSCHGVSLAEFAINRNICPMQMQALQQRLLTQGTLFAALIVREANSLGTLLPTLLGIHFHNQYRDQVVHCLAIHHLEQPDLLGIDEHALFTAMEFSGPALFFNALLRSLVGLGEIIRTGTLLHLPGHQVSQSEEEQHFLRKLRPILLNAGNVAPRVFELMEMLSMDQSTLEQLLKLNCQAGKLLQISRNRFYLPETMLQIAQLIEMLASEHSETGFSVIQFRDASGIGRNLCIEILEYLDAQGLTRRQGNARVLRTNKENIFSLT